METVEAMVVDMEAAAVDMEAAEAVVEDMAPLDLRVAGVAAVARTSAAATARATLEVPPGDRVDMVDSVLLRTVVDREATALAAAVVAVIKQHPTTGSSSEDGEHVTRGRRRVDFTGSIRKTWPVSQVVTPHSLSFGLRE